jgi:hypothetical protein
MHNKILWRTFAVSTSLGLAVVNSSCGSESDRASSGTGTSGESGLGADGGNAIGSSARVPVGSPDDGSNASASPTEDSSVASASSASSVASASSTYASGDPSSAGASGGSATIDPGGMNSSREAGVSDAESPEAPAAIGPSDSAQPGVEASQAGDSSAAACAGGRIGMASDAAGASSTPVRGFGTVEFSASTTTEIVGLETTLTVPPEPPPSGTLFLWPGLQPLRGGRNYSPIGNGVLQSVLTWGGTCAPTAPNTYASWWVSGQYVNTYASYMGHTGCLGGEGIDVEVGDTLHMTMTLRGTLWSQVVVDETSGRVATFDIDMLGQAQNWALFIIEQPSQKPVSDVVFSSTKLTFLAPDPAACQPTSRGTNDYFAAPQSSPDGTQCCVSRIVLRAQGVSPTTPDAP